MRQARGAIATSFLPRGLPRNDGTRAAARVPPHWAPGFEPGGPPGRASCDGSMERVGHTGPQSVPSPPWSPMATTLVTTSDASRTSRVASSVDNDDRIARFPLFGQVPTELRAWSGIAGWRFESSSAHRRKPCNRGPSAFRLLPGDEVAHRDTGHRIRAASVAYLRDVKFE